MNKSSLERKLQAIQELKEQKYVGTGEALRYLKRVAALYENTPILVKMVNERMGKVLSVHYPATEERVLGLGYGLNILISLIVSHLNDNFSSDTRDSLLDTIALEADSEEGDYDENYEKEFNRLLRECTGEDLRLDIELLYSKKRIYENPLHELREIVTLAESSDSSIHYDMILDETAEYLTNIFLGVQSQHFSNRDLIKNTLETVSKDYPHSRKRLLELARSFESQVKWEELLLPINRHKVEGRIVSQIYSDEFDTEARIKRIINDQIDDRLERRREIIAEFLTIKEAKSYEEALEIAKDKLSYRTERLNKFIKLNAPEIVIERGKELVKLQEFLSSLLKSEERFVRKLLDD